MKTSAVFAPPTVRINLFLLIEVLVLEKLPHKKHRKNLDKLFLYIHTYPQHQLPKHTHRADTLEREV